jgi:hypothetical protein
MTTFLHNISLEKGSDIQFKTTAGADAGKIEQDGNDLVLSNAAGDILLGDGSSDVYIGDGANNVDIVFEQSGEIRGDGSAITLTLGGSNTTLNLENPNINGNVTLNATSINNALTLTGSSSKIIFDYEAGQTGEYTNEVPLLQLDRGGSPISILSRVSSGGAIVLGADDMVHIAAGDTKAVIKDNLNMSAEEVVFSSEAGFTAYGFPSNDTSWANRVAFRFRADSGTASQNGLYIGDGGNTQFIDLSRNLINIGTIGSGAITSTGAITSNKSSSHVSGNITAANAHLDLYNSLEANTDQKGSIITFTDNYYSGSSYNKTTRAAIKGGTDTVGNTADGYLEFYTDSAGADSPTLALRIDSGQNSTFSGNIVVSGTVDGIDIATDVAANTAKETNVVQTTVTGNAGTVTNGVYTNTPQTISGAKIFTSSIAGTPANADTHSLTLGRTDNSNYWHVNHAGNDFRLYNTASSGSHVLFGIDSGGNVKANNVGIGTATPGQKLDVVGNIAVSGTVDGIDIATDVAANTAKTGITSGQASAITANTAKTGITSGQASAITANTAKTTFPGFGTTSSTALAGDTSIPSISGLAALASPTLTGTPLAPTAAANTNTTQIATTAYVQTELTDLIGGAPGTLDTLNELAAAINDDASYASTLTTALATKLPLSGGVLSTSGNVPLYVRSTGTVSYLQLHNSSTGTNGSNDGLTVGVNGTAGYIWLREAASLNIGTNDTSAITINSSQNATFAGTIGSGAITSTGKITGTELEGTSLDINGNGDISGTLTAGVVNMNSADVNGNLYADRYFQAATGVPTNNLGSPTVTEMALFENQFKPQTTLANSYDNLDDLTFFTRASGTTEGDYTEVTTYSDDIKRKFLRTNSASVIIPNSHNSFRVEFTGHGYNYANAMVGYWSSNSHNTQVHIWKRRCSDNTWIQHTSSSTTVSSWPGHMYMPFSTIPWHETNTSSTGHYNKIRIEFTPNWIAYSGSGTDYSGTDIQLYGAQIWGGYPSGKRTVHSYDQNGKLDLFKDLGLPDNGRATFGGGDDLSIYHDGSNSYIKDSGPGSLYTYTDAYRLTNAAGNENMIWAAENSFVKLYYDNSAKLETVAAGIDVTGNIVVSGTVDGIDIATDVAANTAKTGITSGQASAITANTAKETNVVQTTVTGNAGTVTNGVYTTGDQSISGKKSFAGPTKIEQTWIYDMSAGSLDTTGFACAGLSSGSNGSSATFAFECGGSTGNSYQRIVYNCWNVSGTWNTSKNVDEGGNKFDVTASANGSTITFTFKGRSSTQSYTPRVHVQATGQSIVTTY